MLKRKTPLKSRKVLARTPMKRTPMKRRKSKSSYATRERAPQAWWDFLHREPCFVFTLVSLRKLGIEPVIPGIDAETMRSVMELIVESPCTLPMEADHVGDRAYGRKCPDNECAAICKGHHEDRTNGKSLRGAFKRFTKATMRDFVAVAIAYTHRNARSRGVEIPAC